MTQSLALEDLITSPDQLVKILAHDPGVLAFRKANTTVNPTTPQYSSCMVTTGIYSYSRNPMYLGMLLVLLAFAVWLAHALAFLFLPLFVLYMNRFQIQPEERFLSSYFVLVYPAYQAKVRRWL